jgi:hypothetical protein
MSHSNQEREYKQNDGWNPELRGFDGSETRSPALFAVPSLVLDHKSSFLPANDVLVPRIQGTYAS